ncbi:unnamed protein product [Microthlaspi erraticum]|uniref:DUF247 domain-containing protein n=1 Tax=Microthlaspi erraticum TaxID=1685480 RepID=A0A6D2J6G7_9BRAS|nr:unnamed protein product [Microthlaspi erraticum]
MDFTRLGRIFKSESTTEPKGYPGMWKFPKDPEKCCIYRVPEILRSVNSEAYTPQLVIIGPLHHYMKTQALNSLGDVPNTKSMGYVNLEEHKKIYLAKFGERLDGNETIDGFRRTIKQHEKIIRESYSESTTWIESSEFVDMILHDSVFILEFNLRRIHRIRGMKTGDPLIDEPCVGFTIMNDLMLLENQLPYFILSKLFDLIFPIVMPNRTFRELIIFVFGFRDKIGNSSNFRHFTDLARCVRVEKLQGRAQPEFKHFEHMFNADKLHSGGVKFEVLAEELSLEVSFVNGCLKMPCLTISDRSEMTLRNIMALEQCHYPHTAHVSSYVLFMDYLIDTDKDVELLVEKGIIKSWIGEPSSVAKMVNKLGLGIADSGSYYYDIAVKVNAHYSSPLTKSFAILKRGYFGNMWLGTATVAAALLLLMTLVQAVSSVIQVLQNA